MYKHKKNSQDIWNPGASPYSILFFLHTSSSLLCTKKSQKLHWHFQLPNQELFYPSLTSMESEKQPQRRLINRCKVNVDFATPKKVVGRKGAKKIKLIHGSCENLCRSRSIPPSHSSLPFLVQFPHFLPTAPNRFQTCCHLRGRHRHRMLPRRPGRATLRWKL